MARGKRKKALDRAKDRALEWLSKYVRLRDALEYNADNPDLFETDIDHLLVKCCTCDTVKPWHEMEAGHCFHKGDFRNSGALLDERNVNAQCTHCNNFRSGNDHLYREFIHRKYGEQVYDELFLLHRIGHWTEIKCRMFAVHYKQMYEQLRETRKLIPHESKK